MKTVSLEQFHFKPLESTYVRMVNFIAGKQQLMTPINYYAESLGEQAGQETNGACLQLLVPPLSLYQPSLRFLG